MKFVKALIAAFACLAVMLVGSPAHAMATQNWGLDRLDQVNLPLNGQYTDNQTGTGVTVFVIDSGARLTHTQFGGRAVFGADFTGTGSSDCYGHGTAVNGQLGGSLVGVVNQVKMVQVKVTNCAGAITEANVVSALSWISLNYQTYSARSAYAGHPDGVLINMSLAFNASTVIDTAVNNIMNQGFPVIAAAGNFTQSACNYSPARVARVITVGATNSNDGIASFSNNGSCVDVFAPGELVYSTTNNNDTSQGLWNGTSFAAPLVTGLAAVAVGCTSLTDPVTWLQSYFATGSGATSGHVTGNLNGAPNRLAYRHAGWCP